MDQTNQLKPKRTHLYVLLGLICLAIFGGIVYWQYQKPEKKSSATEQNSSSENAQQLDSSAPAPTQPVSKAESFYQQGSEALTSKNYSEAIKDFDQAIAADAYEPQYYSGKSEAQVNLGDKQGAINTLKQGSSLNPDSDLLKSKLDVLTKDFFSDPSAATPRE